MIAKQTLEQAAFLKSLGQLMSVTGQPIRELGHSLYRDQLIALLIGQGIPFIDAKSVLDYGFLMLAAQRKSDERKFDFQSLDSVVLDVVVHKFPNTCFSLSEVQLLGYNNVKRTITFYGPRPYEETVVLDSSECEPLDKLIE